MSGSAWTSALFEFDPNCRVYPPGGPPRDSEVAGRSAAPPRGSRGAPGLLTRSVGSRAFGVRVRSRTATVRLRPGPRVDPAWFPPPGNQFGAHAEMPASRSGRSSGFGSSSGIGTFRLPDSGGYGHSSTSTCPTRSIPRGGREAGAASGPSRRHPIGACPDRLAHPSSVGSAPGTRTRTGTATVASICETGWIAWDVGRPFAGSGRTGSRPPRGSLGMPDLLASSLLERSPSPGPAGLGHSPTSTWTTGSISRGAHDTAANSGLLRSLRPRAHREHLASSRFVSLSVARRACPLAHRQPSAAT